MAPAKKAVRTWLIANTQCTLCCRWGEKAVAMSLQRDHAVADDGANVVWLNKVRSLRSCSLADE